VKVSREAINLGGTTANLKFGDILTLKDLLYGMMLPSGNDAAFAIAEYFGRLLYKKSP
jgi:D-alanyl-D-alanine carboxypeptidase